MTSQYQIRPVDEDGNTGPFSNTITVNRINDQVVSDGTDNEVNPRPDSSLPLRDVTVNSFAQLDTNNNIDVFVLSWSLDNLSDNPIAGFEIRIDAEVVGFVNGTTFAGNGVDLFRCRIYSVDVFTALPLLPKTVKFLTTARPLWAETQSYVHASTKLTRHHSAQRFIIEK